VRTTLFPSQCVVYEIQNDIRESRSISELPAKRHSPAGHFPTPRLFDKLAGTSRPDGIVPTLADASMIATGLLILGGIISILAALFLTLLAVDMLQHPGGMGVEKVLAPIIGLVALGLFVLSGFCMYWASRFGKRTTSEQPPNSKMP
jgi:hypothetical protein